MKGAFPMKKLWKIIKENITVVLAMTTAFLSVVYAGIRLMIYVYWMGYFKELNIQIDASDNEVKNAYFNMTKKYPPEKFPKEYRVIRDAYETLIDKSKRDAYILETFDIEIKNILNEGIDLAKSEKYDLAALNFEKVLKKYPDNSKVKKDLAVCLMRGRNYKKSSKILKEFVIREPNYIENYKLLINA